MKEIRVIKDINEIQLSQEWSYHAQDKKIGQFVDLEGKVIKKSHEGSFYRSVGKWKRESTDGKIESIRFVIEQQPKEPTIPPAVLYISISANPPHLGHMTAIATAIEGLRERCIPIEKCYVSLSYETYIQGKVFKENQRIEAENHQDQEKIPLKTLLSREERIVYLNATIEEAARRNMFQGVPVSYWDDQVFGPCDHPEHYPVLAKMESERRLYFVGGADLCEPMGNWPDLNHVIIVKRNGAGPSNCNHVEEEDYSRLILEGKYQEYTHFSSSAIQAGNYEMLVPALRDRFKALKEKGC